MIDTIHRIETPEGIELTVHPAGPVARGLALAIDILIRTAIMAAVMAGALSLGQMGIGLALVIFFLTASISRLKVSGSRSANTGMRFS